MAKPKANKKSVQKAVKQKPASPVVGLDIGTRWIKAVELRPAKDGAVITGIGYEPTPEGAIVEDAILDTSAVAAAITRLFKNSGITVKKVISSVSGQSSVVVRIIEVPKMSEAELAETMKWEVERHIPFPSSEVVMDFKPLERPSTLPGAPDMEVLLAVCQENVVLKHIDALESAKLEPVAVEVQALALPRSLIHHNGDLEESNIVGVVDIGNEATNVGIYEKKLLVFPRSVPIAGINLIRAISQELGIDEGDAEERLRQQGYVDLALLEELANPAPAPEPEPPQFDPDAMQTMGFSTPFTDPDVSDSPFASPFAPDMPDMPAGHDEEPAAPKVTGFDLGDDDFLSASSASPFALDDEAEPPKTSGVFDLGGEELEEGDRQTGPFDLNATFGDPEPPSSSPFDLGDGPDLGGAPDLQIIDGEDELHTEPQETELDIQPITPSVPVRSAGGSQDVARAIAPVVMDLAAELGRSLDYYNTRNPEPASVLVLCGGVAKLPGLAAYLENSLGLTVKVGDPVAGLPVNSKRYAPEYISEVAPAFSTCVGLALRDFVREDA